MAFSTDKRLWRYGSKVASSLGHGVAWELDFLRGMHQGNALRYLARELTSATGLAIQLTSIWLDKHAWVTWYQGGNRVDQRELADLAVGVGESWIGDLTDDEIKSIFSLSSSGI